ncbi:MAG: hypothetical protein M3271_06815 [Actinomycetota bacterium]|nr:hypothetical protein [Actinomycetota bacterium]
MRRLALPSLALVAVAGGAWLVFARGDTAGWPSTASVGGHGFAVWPEDTVAEARSACESPPGWRLDASATAERFAGDVLRYPAPSADELESGAGRARFLVGSDGIDGVFLGSVLELRRYGSCWFLVRADPREGELDATVAFVHRIHGPHLLLSEPGDVPIAHVGYGSWDEAIGPGYSSIVVGTPLETGETGHVIFTRPDETGVSESVAARPLASSRRRARRPT